MKKMMTSVFFFLIQFQTAYCDSTVDKLMELQNIRGSYEAYLKSYPVNIDLISRVDGEFILGKDNPIVIQLNNERKAIHTKYFSWSKFRKQYQKLYLELYTAEERTYLLEILQNKIGHSTLKKYTSFPFNASGLDIKNIKEFNVEIENANSKYENQIRL